jgi:hypothetical protein
MLLVLVMGDLCECVNVNVEKIGVCEWGLMVYASGSDAWRNWRIIQLSD